MVKLGRTAAGGHAAASHTGAMAGSDSVCDAALRQCGVIRVDDCNELYEAAMLLRTRRWPRGTRAAATTISGGNGVLLVDHGAALGITWPEYTRATRATLRGILPKIATTANPTDVSNAVVGKPEIFRRCIEVIANDENIDVVIPTFTMTPACDLQAAVDASKTTAKPVAMLWIGKRNDDPNYTHESMAAGGMPGYRKTLSCPKAGRPAMRYGEFLRHRMTRAAQAARPARVDGEAARRQLHGGWGTSTEYACILCLDAFCVSGHVR